MRRTAAALLSLLLSSCRFGGPEGDPRELVEPNLPDAEVEMVEDAQADAELPSEPTPSDAAAEASCSTPMVMACDPVRGTGCIQGVNQCVADRSASSPAGHCVFNNALTSGQCEENVVWTTCPALFTCVSGTCLKYCYCDADCEPSDTCTESGEQGAAAVFKICKKQQP